MRLEEDSFEQQARDAHELVGRVLVGFGFGVVVAAVVLGPVTHADLRFLTAVDMGILGAMMVGLGAWLRGSAGAE